MQESDFTRTVAGEMMWNLFFHTLYTFLPPLEFVSLVHAHKSDTVGVASPTPTVPVLSESATLPVREFLSGKIKSPEPNLDHGPC